MVICEKPIKKFLIIDLAASLPYTHHKHSIYAFADLLTAKNIDYQIWVPIGSEIDRFNLPVRKILLAGTHAASFKLFKINTWLNSVLNKLLLFLVKGNSKFLIHKRVLLTTNYLGLLLSRVKSKYSGIIFTTACPFAIHTVYALEASGMNFTVFFRLTNTSENRGALGELYDFNQLIKDSKDFKNIVIRFGIETENYFSKISSEHDSTFYISNFPYIKKPVTEIDNNKSLTISFLGYPTRDKGQEHVFPIINQVSKKNSDYNWQVQLYENDPLYFPLKKIKTNLLVVSGKISTPRMEELMSKTDILCLPYNPKSFEFHASAMHYSSMDHLIPVVCFEGSAFAYDVLKFNSGMVTRNLQEMCEVLLELSKDQIREWKIGCQNYNTFRITTNENFLDL